MQIDIFIVFAYNIAELNISEFDFTIIAEFKFTDFVFTASSKNRPQPEDDSGQADRCPVVQSSAGYFFALWKNNSAYFSLLILYFPFDADYHMITVRE